MKSYVVLRLVSFTWPVLKFIHMVARILFLFIDNYEYYTFIVHSLMDGYTHCFHFLSIMNNTAMNPYTSLCVDSANNCFVTSAFQSDCCHWPLPQTNFHPPGTKCPAHSSLRLQAAVQGWEQQGLEAALRGHTSPRVSFADFAGGPVSLRGAEGLGRFVNSTAPGHVLRWQPPVLAPFQCISPFKLPSSPWKSARTACLRPVICRLVILGLIIFAFISVFFPPCPTVNAAPFLARCSSPTLLSQFSYLMGPTAKQQYVTNTRVLADLLPIPTISN